MDIGSILLFLALSLLVGIYVTRPFFTHQGFKVTETDRKLSTLEAERDKTLAIIQELDMDQAMGKLEQDDYESQRALMVARGAEVFKEIDSLLLPKAKRPTPPAEKTPPDADAALEAAVARLRRSAGGEQLGFCGQCGKPLVAGDRFCSSCGAVVEAEGAA